MSATVFAPNLTPAAEVATVLGQSGLAVLSPPDLAALTGHSLAQFALLAPSWDGLPPDEHLRDAGRYRRRRHSCYVARGGEIEPVPHRAHWQPVEYNALHGGMQRWFAPVTVEVSESLVWRALLRSLADLCSRVKGRRPWYIEAHQFRIDTADGIGRPTPEGAHRDGVDFVAVLLVARHRVKGGETRVFEADGPAGQRFTLTEPWTTLLLDDARVIHETTPIQPTAEGGGWRDTLVLTFREGGFQGD